MLTRTDNELFQEYCQRQKEGLETLHRMKWYDGVRKLLTELYPDNAHFIYELLQNAEDKGATRVWFRLKSDRLIFEHNGPELFSFKNVEAITGIGQSTSRDEPTKIGKFGVGFKAVFAYTDTPEIHSGDYHFRIRDLVVPESDGIDCTPLGPITRFVFPFNHRRKSPKAAIEDIQHGLLDLPDNALLFLSHIESLDYEFPDGSQGFIRRIPLTDAANVAPSIERDLFEIHRSRTIDPGQTKNADSTDMHRSTWMRFEKTVDVIDTEDDEKLKLCRLSIAFEMRQNDSKGASSRKSSRLFRITDHKIVSVQPGQVSIYFPAVDEKPQLRFHINAPFASTVSRASVRKCPVNEFLRDQLALLAAQSLTHIRDIGLLSADFLSVLPLSTDNLPPFYAPIRSRIVAAFKTTALTPTRCGRHRKASRLLRSPDEITSRLTNRDLAALTMFKSYRWAATLNGEQSLRGEQFLASIGVEEWGYEDIRDAAQGKTVELAKSWLEAKDAVWVCSLYRDLHRSSRSSGKVNARDAAIAYPVIRLRDGSHVFAAAPDLYLSVPDGVGPQFQTVSPDVWKDKDAEAFLKSLGITAFDRYAEITELVIPKYQKKKITVAFNEHLMDLAKIKSVWQLATEVKSLRIVKCVNAATGFTDFKRGSEVYFDSPQLRTYFQGNFGAWFVAPEYNFTEADWLRTFFTKAGASDCPREFHSETFHKRLKADNERGVDGFNPQWLIDGLDHALANPTIERSAYLWNEVLPGRIRLISGYIERSRIESFPSDRSKKGDLQDSTAGSMLKRLSWIPNRIGEFVTASELGGIEMLHESLTRNESLLSCLDNGRSSSQKEAAKTLKIESVSPQVLEKLRENEAAKKSFLSYLEEATGGSERRAERVREQSDNAAPRRFAMKERSTRIGRVSPDDVLNYLELFYVVDGTWYCQMCCYPMPYRKRNGDECHDCPELLTGAWAKRKELILPTTPTEEPHLAKGQLPEHEKLHIVLCPLCSSLFHEYVTTCDPVQDALLAWLQSGSGTTFTIECSSFNTDQSDRSVHFHPKHLGDIRAIRAIGDPKQTSS